MDGLVFTPVEQDQDFNNVCYNRYKKLVNKGIMWFNADFEEVKPREVYFHGSTSLFKQFKTGAEACADGSALNACYLGKYQNSISIADNLDASLHFATKSEVGYIYIVKPREDCVIIKQHELIDANSLGAFIPYLLALGIDAVEISDVESETVIINKDAFYIEACFMVEDADDLYYNIDAFYGNAYGRGSQYAQQRSVYNEDELEYLYGDDWMEYVDTEDAGEDYYGRHLYRVINIIDKEQALNYLCTLLVDLDDI